MKFKLLIIALSLIAFVNVFSAPIKNMPVQVKQPDGEIIDCFASGDEFYNWLHDSVGFTIIQSQSDGYYYYAVQSGDSLLPSKILIGKGNPALNGIVPWLKVAYSKRKAEVEEYLKHRQKPRTNDDKKNKTMTNNIGTIQNLVVFIRFSGESEFSDLTSTYNSMFNPTSGNSMKNYFTEVSYNQLTVNTNFYPVSGNSYVASYQDAQLRTYYQPYNAITNPNGYTSANRTSREHILLANAINYVSSQIPATLTIDNDDDGYVDNICFIVSGATTAWSTMLWPHMWSLYTQNVSINGDRVYSYNFQIRNHLVSSGVGVLAHEMFHSLGAPDLYHYTDNDITPVGSWDLMEWDQNPPQHMSAYMKWKYGTWLSIPQISASGTYTLSPLTSSTNNCYRINSPNSTIEYFVVEYRKDEGTFESSIPGSGLLIYRINSAYEGNADGPPDEVYLYRPGGTTTVDGAISNANYSSSVGRISINSSTNPTPFLTNGSAGGLDISGIGAVGSTITFTVSLSRITTSSFAGISLCGGTNFSVPYIAPGSYNSGNVFTAQLSDSDGDFSSPIVLGTLTSTATTGTITAVIPTTITTGTGYRIRVVASNPSVNGEDNGIDLTISTYPIPISPVDEAMTGTTPITFSWNSSCYANYEIQVSLNNSFTTTVLTHTLTSTNYQVSTLEHFNTYYWRVRSFSGTNTTEWSPVWNFTAGMYVNLASGASAYTLCNSYFFDNGGKSDDYSNNFTGTATFYPSTPGATIRASFTSFASETGYDYLYVYNGNSISSPLLGTYSGYSNPGTFTSTAADGSLTIRFTSDYSVVRAGWESLISCSVAAPTAPELISPANGLTTVSLMPTFTWNSVSGATSYTLQVSTNSAFTSTVINNTVSAATFATSTPLSANSGYYWRVIASNGTLSSPWSNTWSFTTSSAISTKPIVLQLALQGMVNSSSFTHQYSPVSVELRSGSTLMSSSLVSRKSANVDTYFYVYLDFGEVPDGYYWLVVRSAGYLPIAIPVQLNLISSVTTNYDFRSSSEQAVGGSNAMIQHSIWGIWMMRAGDFNTSRSNTSTDAVNFQQSYGRSVSNMIPAP